MAIFIISRRPHAPWNEKSWSYRTRMTSDNAAVNAEFNRERAYAKLRKVVEAMAHSWRVAEPDTLFRVVDTGLGQRDTMPAEFIAPGNAPIIPGDEDGAAGHPVGGFDPTELPSTAWARRLITKAERDLHRTLSAGERRDLLSDNTRWGRDVIVAAVAALDAEAVS